MHPVSSVDLSQASDVQYDALLTIFFGPQCAAEDIKPAPARSGSLESQPLDQQGSPTVLS